MKKTVIIADDNAVLVADLKEFFASVNDYDVVAVAENGKEALAAIEKFDPDFLLLDIVMPELDGFGVLSALTKPRPTVIMMSQLNTDAFVQKALRYGAKYFLAKPFDLGLLLRTLDDFSQENDAPAVHPRPAQRQSVRRDRSLDEKIANLFISVGIPAHIKGYQFLREAIKITVDDPEIINSITKRLYPSVAAAFNTTPSKVERAIRHAIEVAWNRGKIENINNIFGMKIYSANEKPTNGEFIALVADKMLLDPASRSARVRRRAPLLGGRLACRAVAPYHVVKMRDARSLRVFNENYPLSRSFSLRVVGVTPPHPQAVA